MECKREDRSLAGLNAPPVDEGSALDEGGEQVRATGFEVLSMLNDNRQCLAIINVHSGHA